MKMNVLRFTLFGCALAMFVSAASSQTVTGSISGQVTDPSGAVLPGAHVVAADLDTNVSTTTTTNADGLYRIDFLPIGHYQVTVEANGFATRNVAAILIGSAADGKFQREAHGGKLQPPT